MTWAAILVLGSALSWASALGPAPDRGEAEKPAAGPGITEHVGDRIPADIVVRDEGGRALRIVELMDRPAILALVYYTCEHVCPLVLGALGETASAMALAPGRDYRLITFSFDGTDTPQDAATARANYTKPVGRELAPGAWSFLTAAPADIAKLTDALGFRFAPDSHGFIHPAVLVVLGPGGRISRYIHVTRTAYGVGYPVTFPPVAMGEALRLAGAGGPSGRDPAPLLFCYPHEPPSQGRFYGLMTALGVGTLALLLGLFVTVSFVWKRPRPGAGGP